MEELMAEIIDLDSKRKVKTVIEETFIGPMDQGFIKEILTIAYQYYKKKNLVNKTDAVFNMLQNWEDV